MLNAEPNDLAWLFPDALQDAISPASGRPDPGQLSAERLAHASRLADQRGRQELDHGDRGLGQLLGDGSRGRRG
jgi:hypothetical protein